MNDREDIVFSRNTVEFVTVAAEFCAYVERSNEHDRKEFVDTLLKLLPLLYLKAQMLPDEEIPEQSVADATDSADGAEAAPPKKRKKRFP